MTDLHPIQRRWRAEDLVRRRRSDEQRRYAAPQRSGRVDTNPHQIEAVIFALSRLGDGGCILADEVGLGKTIEAGLVIAQLRAEGARRVLLITPKSLLGQWRQELYALFGIEAMEGLDGEEGVFLLGREAAGSVRGQAQLLASSFDLVVIDEAHEIFAGLYKRFDAQGQIKSAPVASTAWRVFEFIQASHTPVLLLTATPIQNSLTELWALVRFVDPTGTLLGDLGTFRQTFCNGDDRTLADGQEPELRRRIHVVLRRTLRRQAQEFLSKPFVERRAWLLEYPMASDERSLYDEVTHYILSPRLVAFRGNQRRLLLIAFQRRLASSTAALAASLRKVAERLELMLKGLPVEDELFTDLDDAELLALIEEQAADSDDPPTPEQIQAELARVRGFVERADAVRTASKSRALLDAYARIAARRASGEGSGKVVIFTESVVTQEHLRAFLVAEGGLADDAITLFRGHNDSGRARAATAQWWAEVGDALAPHSRPSPDVAVRLALVHEFKTRSDVFISTEAGAKGLNLQFCETVINYDLPWNPQRIEQRIGRCHRYGQTRAVTVINFLAKDNETERLMFDLLARKLELFGTVLDSSSAVLHSAGDGASEALASAIGAELEAQMSRIWRTAGSIEDVNQELRRLHDEFGDKKEQFEDEQRRTAALIESYFDEPVRQVFARRQAEIPAALHALDQELEQLVVEYLDARGVPRRIEVIEGERVLDVQPSARLPAELGTGLRVTLGATRTGESLHLAHPLTRAAVVAAREHSPSRVVAVTLPPDAPRELLERRGGLARLVGVLVRHHGLESVDRLLLVVIFEGESEPISSEAAQALIESPMRGLDGRLGLSVADEAIEDAIDEALFVDRQSFDRDEGPRYQRGLEQLERYVEDRLFLLHRRKTDLERRLGDARDKRSAALALDTREQAEKAIAQHAENIERLEAEIARLEARDDDTYRRCKTRLTQRRYAPPRVERLFDVEMLVE